MKIENSVNLLGFHQNTFSPLKHLNIEDTNFHLKCIQCTLTTTHWKAKI